ELLAIKSIEDDNDFFALGGHSLMAMDLVFSVQERFGVSIELGKFLQHPTLAAMLQAAHAHQITVASISNNSKESQSEKNQNDLPSVIASPAKMAALENNLERIPEYVPMTPLQKRLHVISQRVLQPEMFQIVALYGFKSKLKGADLRNIWLQLTQAHDAFYLEFDTDNWTQKRGNVCRAVVDWIELNDALTSDSPWIQKRLAKPLYIEQGPLAEISVIETLAGEQQLLIRVHHLIFDGESLRALLQEFLNATVENSLPSKKAPSFLRYAWNASQSNAQRTSANAYWLEQLNQSLPVLDWVLPDSRPPVKQSRGALLSRQLSSTHTQALVDLAREQKCSIQELLLTIHAALLSYLTGAEEVMVGVPFLPLHEREDYQVVGCRIEVLPVRLGFSFGASFKQLVEATCEALRSAISHGHANFTEVLESIRLSPDMSRTPLYQSLFTFLDNRSTQAPVGLKNWHEVWINRHVVQHDLDAWLFLSEQGLEIHWEYDIALFSLQQIEKAMDIFIKGLESAAHNSATQPLLWNEKKPTPVLVGNVVSIKPGRVLGVAHSLAFERLPKPVLSLGQHAWNYRQLWQAACAVRDALIAENVVPDAFVGICMTRGPEWLPAILGIWLAGAAYVPLDPDYPIDRICSMLEDSGMQHVIADSLVIDEIPELERVKVIAWQSTWWDRDSGADSAQFEVQSVIRSANQPAYMIYTSGSTGKPKGVVIGHGALDSFLQSMKSKPGLKNTDRLLAVTTFSFDISILELMLPILVGAHIVMAQRDDTMDGHRLAEIIQKQEISVMQATPATWRLLQAAGWRAHPAFKALSGGEALDNNLAEELLKYCAEVWNLYGPTEATIWATAHKLESADDILSLGQPVANTELYILDASGRSVPPFVRGELVIAGDCVALGYHNREALNRERFFEINGRRVYRTGDWVSFNNQNNIRFHGRIDHQIKLRGFRIELGEIERVLEQHPEVRKSIVFVTGEENRQHLVACLQIQGEQTSAEQIRIYLENHLPMYMVPTQWIVVQDLPTTPSGKIDRARLMSLASEHRQEPQEAVVWANADIEFLAGCWAKILQLDMIRPTDHFFSLGGHSLLAMRVIEQIQREKKVRFTIRDLVMANLEQLAERLNNAPLVQDYKLIEPFAVEEEKRPWWKFSFKSKK
ncbi:MAG: amino acid adenylation domain-containing protein, partial [Pseudomonadota bacterium]